MTRTLTRAGICAAALLLLAPVFAFAAADDVTLTTDTVLSVNGVTLNVSGSSATRVHRGSKRNFLRNALERFGL